MGDITKSFDPFGAFAERLANEIFVRLSASQDFQERIGEVFMAQRADGEEEVDGRWFICPMATPDPDTNMGIRGAFLMHDDNWTALIPVQFAVALRGSH